MVAKKLENMLLSHISKYIKRKSKSKETGKIKWEKQVQKQKRHLPKSRVSLFKSNKTDKPYHKTELLGVKKEDATTGISDI